MSDTRPSQPGGSHPPTADLLADQRRRWQQGQRVLVENYLAQYPQLRGDADAVLDLLYNEIFLREQHGEAPRLEEYVQRFPQWRGDLEVQFEVHQAIQPGGLPPPTPGRVEIPAYEILGEIGRGGMGIVYKARDVRQNRLVAVKTLLPDQFEKRTSLKRFLAESRAIVALSHPNIVTVHEVGECAAGPYYVMELIEGPSLAEIIAHGPIPVPWVVTTLLPIVDAVEHAHGKGIIHRDLKPSNILIDAQRGPVVMDFGLAKFRAPKAMTGLSTGTASGMIVGTPAFIPPEQTGTDLSAVGPYSDVYALGAILYMLLTRRPPFDEGSVITTIMKVRSPEPPESIRSLRAEVPAELESICMKCLAKPSVQRYQTAFALGEALRRFQAHAASPSAVNSSGCATDAAPCLVDPTTGKKWNLAEGTTLLGRASQCDIVVAAPDVSRRHCQILVHSGQATVEDLGSLRGTFVNGTRVNRAPLEDGDRLDIADHSFRFQHAR
jgi:serine/threonine protein kinase